jgi:hypothetical protein
MCEDESSPIFSAHPHFLAALQYWVGFAKNVV